MKNSGLVFIRIIIGVLAVFALIVVGYQLYKYNFVSIKTEGAIMGEIEEVVKSTGVFFRNEEPISKNQHSYLDVIRAEGERVAAGGALARVYADEKSAIERTEIRRIEERIETYKQVLSNSGSYTNASKGIDDEIYSDLNSIAESVQNRNAADAFETADALLIEIMKKKIASGDLVHYDRILKELESELDDLKNSTGDSVQTIKTNDSGYFSLITDGLEDELTPERLETLEVQNFGEAVFACEKSENSEDYIGKIVYGNSWTIATKIPSDACSGMDVKDTVYIRIPSFGNERIKCTVADLRKSGSECVLVLESSTISGNILTLRCEEISLILHTHSGIQVRQSALRKVDGKDGVFVKVGLLLRYKEVKILFNDGTNAIIEYEATDTGALRLYDQVVYKGSNLYDGKAVTDG